MARICSKTNFDGPVPQHAPHLGSCWEYGGHLSNGYGRTTAVGYSDNTLVHRISYEYFNGSIPDDLPLDHLCRNTRCFRPDHLEAVTARVNTLRSTSPSAINAIKTHCHNGHPLSGDNLYIIPTTGSRSCKTCTVEAGKRYAATEKGLAATKARQDCPLIKEAARKRAAAWYAANRERAAAAKKAKKALLMHNHQKTD